MRSLFYLAVAILLLGCGNTVRDERARGGGGSAATVSVASSSASTAGSGAGGVSVDYCAACSEALGTGTLAAAEVDEASGLAASRKHAGIYYLHNDSGDDARFFAIAEDGSERARYRIDGASAVDWEDAAAGPCGEGSCVFLGDVGDNAEARNDYRVHMVEEPAAIVAGEHAVPSSVLRFRYPDGSHDSETLLVHPIDGRIYIVTKVAIGPSQVFRFPMPLDPDGEVTLIAEGTVTPPQGIAFITAGDIHPAGAGVLLRTYTSLFFYPLTGGVGEALARDGCQLPVANEPQGETVSWTAAGDGYLTVSEGAGSPVYLSSCAP